MNSRPLILIDSDIYLHQAAANNEEVVEWDGPEEVVSIFSDLKKCKQSYEHYTQPFYELGDVIHCVSWGDNFRKKVLPTYKGNRTKRKPVGFGPLKRWLMDTKPVKYVEGLEADDLLGILGTRKQGRDVLIVSEDKDLLTIPGTILRGGKTFTVTEEEADRNWLLQTLTGDVTDGYSGCPGIGKVKAQKILSFVPNEREPWVVQAWRHVLSAYAVAGILPEDALVQARVARILRDSDFNPETREPILWSPPSA